MLPQTDPDSAARDSFARGDCRYLAIIADGGMYTPGADDKIDREAADTDLNRQLIRIGGRRDDFVDGDHDSPVLRSFYAAAFEYAEQFNTEMTRLIKDRKEPVSHSSTTDLDR